VRQRRGDMEWNQGETRAVIVPDITVALAECLAAHAEALDRHGTDRPELSDAISVKLREKMQRQRGKVAATFENAEPEHQAVHVAALTKGLRAVMRRLCEC
jgi:hypothetical protein